MEEVISKGWQTVDQLSQGNERKKILFQKQKEIGK